MAGVGKVLILFSVSCLLWVTPTQGRTKEDLNATLCSLCKNGFHGDAKDIINLLVSRQAKNGQSIEEPLSMGRFPSVEFVKKLEKHCDSHCGEQFKTGSGPDPSARDPEEFGRKRLLTPTRRKRSSSDLLKALTDYSSGLTSNSLVSDLISPNTVLGFLKKMGDFIGNFVDCLVDNILTALEHYLHLPPFFIPRRKCKEINFFQDLLQNLYGGKTK